MRSDFPFKFQQHGIGWWKIAGFDLIEERTHWTLKQTGGKYRCIQEALPDIKVFYYSVALMVEKIESERRKGSET